MLIFFVNVCKWFIYLREQIESTVVIRATYLFHFSFMLLKMSVHPLHSSFETSLGINVPSAANRKLRFSNVCFGHRWHVSPVEMFGVFLLDFGCIPSPNKGLCSGERGEAEHLSKGPKWRESLISYINAAHMATAPGQCAPYNNAAHSRHILPK